ncbi:hypothetical protein OSTOST_02599 [Ostertagia ostertagi]
MGAHQKPETIDFEDYPGLTDTVRFQLPKFSGTPEGRHSPSSFVTDSGISDEDYTSDTPSSVDENPRKSTKGYEQEGSGWMRNG